MNFKKILLGVIVVVILYLVYVYVFSDTTSSVLYSGGNAKNVKKIKATMLPSNKQSVNFTFSIWVYVNNWQYRYGVEKVIYRRLDDGPNKSTSPQVSLGAATNQLAITIDTCPVTGTTGTANTCPSTPNSWTVNNIPIQKWCNIIISTNNRAVDTYIDGKLVNTHVLINVPKINNNAPIFVTPDGGFSGNTSKFRYLARVISPIEAYEIYREGPGGNWLSDLMSQYKLKLSFWKGSEEINSFEI